VILSLLTPPDASPVSLGEAKAHMRIEHDAENGLVAGLVGAAVDLFEQETGRQVMAAKWRATMSAFPRGSEPLTLPRPPLTAVTLVTYTDQAGAPQTWASSEYSTAAPAGPYAARGSLYPRPGKLWPATYGAPGSAIVEFTAGYAVVPDALKLAVLAIAAEMYINREAGSSGLVRGTAARIIDSFRPLVYA
jgi:uncharacterized phiE125 gp8 family phage protein